MKFKIVKLINYSGVRASVYSVIIDDDSETLFDRFTKEYVGLYKDELSDIAKRIRSMATETGARKDFFKENEGVPGDGVCALYDEPDKKMRLYCIRYGTEIVILGGGGEKPKNIRALQESEKLKKENYLIREISKAISKRIRNKEIWFSWEDNEIIGNLELDTDEEDY